MFCRKCGTELCDDANFCPKCGSSQNDSTVNQSAPENQIFDSLKKINLTGAMKEAPVHGKTPKCTHCGYVGNWKSGPVLRPIDFIIGIALLLFGFIPGLVYLGVVALIRYNPDRREKICPQCKAQNMWTFLE